MIESILIILACIFLIIVVGFMFFSERSISKKNNQPTIRELNKYYKELEIQTEDLEQKNAENKNKAQLYVIDMRAVRLLASTIVSTISRITLFIFNNGTSPCTINKINIEPQKMDNLYMDEEEFRRCN